MSHSLSKILLHVVFSTKDRTHIISSSRLNALHGYLASVIIDLNGRAYKVGGITNHVHIAMNLPRTITIGKMLEKIKIVSSKWMKMGKDNVADFKWQSGYGVFSLGESQLPNLIRYIDNQPNHHKIKTYKDELEDIRIKYNLRRKDICQL